MPRHLDERTNLDSGLVHVDRKPGDAGVLRRIGVGAGDEHAHVGRLAERGPDLLPVDHPFVAVSDGLGGQAGKIGAGAGLAEQLAPCLLAGDDVSEQCVDLLLGPILGNGGRRQHQPEARWPAECPELGDLS